MQMRADAVLVLVFACVAQAELVNTTGFSPECEATLGTVQAPPDCSSLPGLLSAEGIASCVGDIDVLSSCAIDPSLLTAETANATEPCPLCVSLPADSGCASALSTILDAVRTNASLASCKNEADIAALVLLRDQGTVGCNAAQATPRGDLDMNALRQCSACGVIPCVPGMYCPGNALPAFCEAGHYCPSSTEMRVRQDGGPASHLTLRVQPAPSSAGVSRRLILPAEQLRPRQVPFPRSLPG